jgi:uncharacterized protein (DUF305 family)
MTVMTPRHGRWITSALLVAFAAAGCASGSGGTVRTSSASDSDLTAIATARADSARHKYTDADIAFMSNMIGHHAQAIAMARMAPDHGASASIRTLAGRIINAQNDEIKLMQQWLRERGKPVPEVTAAGKMIMGGMEHEHLMPGMLTESQMQQLAAAKGADFDRMFLTYMIQHHQGAVAMVKELFGSHGAGQDDTVFKLASDVNVDQETEIKRMQGMLAELLFGTKATPP